MNPAVLPGAHFGDPISACLEGGGRSVLAFIADVDGPSYRPLGACMAIHSQDERAGNLSSGCVEADISLHALDARQVGQPRLIRYGKGSPFFDIQLPCGGGLEILLLPTPQFDVLRELHRRRKARIPVTLRIDVQTGEMSLDESGATSRKGDILTIRYEPDPRFLIFGKGPEACTFATLAQAAGYANLLISPDQETLNCASDAGSETRHLTNAHLPDELSVDHRTAIVLFFHDHDWEPGVLMGALKTDAFYVGAQGSRAASETRLARLRELGATDADLERLSGPIGLIPSARDPRTLAISVLSEVIARLQEPRS